MPESGWQDGEEVELVVAPLVDGPLAGEEREVPAGHPECFMHDHVTGLYFVYKLGHEGAYFYAGRSLNERELLDHLVELHQEDPELFTGPWMHAEERVPRARRTRLRRA